MLEYTLGFMALPEYLVQHHGFDLNKENSQVNNLFVWRHGRVGETHFDIIKDRPQIIEGFQSMMRILHQLKSFVGFYDFEELATSDPNQIVLVDIAGGDGEFLRSVLAEFPSIRPGQCVLQELPRVASAARASQLPAAVKVEEHDLFQPQPVTGACAYHLRHITHAWNDNAVVAILSSIARAMTPESKLLIADSIVSPLNGGASGMGCWVDAAICGIGGKERTESELRDLITAAGLKVDGIYMAGGSTCHGILETSLVTMNTA